MGNYKQIRDHFDIRLADVQHDRTSGLMQRNIQPDAEPQLNVTIM
jgi:uncharacterized membrane protein (UPF0127 family)